MIEERLRELGIRLPAARVPAFQYQAVLQHGDTAYVSGQLPWDGKCGLITGKLGAQLDLVQGAAAARACMLQALAALYVALGSLDRIERVLKLTGFVASAPGFIEQPKVIDAASGLLIEVFGDAGRHARSAVGVAELPRGAAVEIELIVAVRAQAR